MDFCDTTQGQKCEFVVNVCDFDPSSRFFVSVRTDAEGSTIDFEISVKEEGMTYYYCYCFEILHYC